MRQRKKARRFGGPLHGPVSRPVAVPERRRRLRPDWPALAALLALCVILCFLFYSLGVSLIVLGKVAVLVAVVVTYFGVIALLDGGSRSALADRPFARTLACGALGVVVAFLLLSLFRNGENSWLWGGAVFGAALGWLGTGWARFL